MFIFRDPLGTDKPESLDPMKVELDRRKQDSAPGQSTAEFAVCGAVSARALMLTEAGFGPPVRVVVVRDLDGGIDRIERAGTAIQPPPQSAEAEDFQPLGGAENAENPKKQESYGLEAPYPVDKASNRREHATENADNDTYYVTVPLKISADPGRQRAHKDDVDWWDKKRVQGHKVSKTLSAKKRALVDDAFLRLKVLKGKGVLVCVTMKPSHLDALSPVERMEYWEPLVNRFRSYRRRRCEILRRQLSSWEVWSVWVRESNPDTHLGEHCHWVVWMPDQEEAEHFIAHVQDPANSKTWGDNVQAMRISATERMVGGKLSSFFNYMLKAAHPRSRFADHTLGWEPSGALVGERFFITDNLKSAEVIAETEAGVAELKRIRGEKKIVASRKRARERAKEEGLYSYSAAPADPFLAPADVHAEPVEADTCPTPGSTGLVHRDQGERRDMDLVEIETRPALPAVIEPTPAFITAATPVFSATAAVAEPGPPPSSCNAPRLAPLAAFGRSMARGIGAAAGWISSMLFDSPGFVSAGAFMGAPDLRGDPW